MYQSLSCMGRLLVSSAQPNDKLYVSCTARLAVYKVTICLETGFPDHLWLRCTL